MYSLGDTSEPYERKQEKSKQRSDKILCRVITLLAPSKDGQSELLQRCVDRQHLVLQQENEQSTVGHLCRAFSRADTAHERYYLLQFVNHMSLQQLHDNGFTTVTKKMLELSRAMGEAIEIGRSADAAATAALTGQGSVTEVVLAVSRAELALQTAVAVRDRIIGAYQEIMRMPI